jgi:hypothetical protein
MESTMTDIPASSQPADLYARFPSCTSKQARQNLPSLLDDVLETGTPVVIKKLNVPRLAIVRARELWLHEIFVRLNMDKSSIDKPIDQLMEEMSEALRKYLQARAGRKNALVADENLGNVTESLPAEGADEATTPRGSNMGSFSDGP